MQRRLPSPKPRHGDHSPDSRPPTDDERLQRPRVTVLHTARRLAQLVGLDVPRSPADDPAHRRVRLIRQHGISHVFDVGGSDGRFGFELRRFGYEGRIVSFEPLETAYRLLARRAARDPLWETLPYALG